MSWKTKGPNVRYRNDFVHFHVTSPVIENDNGGRLAYSFCWVEVYFHRSPLFNSCSKNVGRVLLSSAISLPFFQRRSLVCYRTFCTRVVARRMAGEGLVSKRSACSTFTLGDCILDTRLNIERLSKTFVLHVDCFVTFDIEDKRRRRCPERKPRLQESGGQLSGSEGLFNSE